MPAWSRAMALSGDGSLLLGFDIGGTKTAVVVGTPGGQVVERLAFASQPERGVEAMLDAMERHARVLLARHGEVAGVGASIGGPVDAERGLVLSPPNLPGWDAVPLAALLAARFGCPARVEHDAKACALAEWRHGAGRGASDMVFLTLGTGIGAGIIAGGRLPRGAANLAGEIGHWRVAENGPELYGKRGLLEGWSSGAGIAALAYDTEPRHFAARPSAAELAGMAAAGDDRARAVIGQAGTALGRALALLVDLLAPEMIVLGNLAHRLGATLLDPARAALAAEALPALARRCSVVPCALGESIGDVAALSVAAEACDAG